MEVRGDTSTNMENLKSESSYFRPEVERENCSTQATEN
jgi:hypothetical protein